jgi:hypothetical protein
MKICVPVDDHRIETSSHIRGLKKDPSGIKPITNSMRKSSALNLSAIRLSYSFAELDRLGFCELQQHSRYLLNSTFLINHTTDHNQKPYRYVLWLPRTNTTNESSWFPWLINYLKRVFIETVLHGSENRCDFNGDLVISTILHVLLFRHVTWLVDLLTTSFLENISLFQVDIFQMSLLEFKDRPGRPLYHLEHFIEGEYTKYNSNSGFVDEKMRLTPHVSKVLLFNRQKLANC